MKRTSPAFPRNREPILEVLRRVLPPAGTVLEVGAGPGEHARWLAASLPGLAWLATDRDPEALASIEAWRADGPPNLLPPLQLDLTAPPPPLPPIDAVVAINVLHAAPWDATLGLLALAADHLPPGGPLVVYGAWREGGAAEPSNLAFDADLRARNPAWGIRDVEAVIAAAMDTGFTWEETARVPANNRILVLRRASDTGLPAHRR